MAANKPPNAGATVQPRFTAIRYREMERVRVSGVLCRAIATELAGRNTSDTKLRKKTAPHIHQKSRRLITTNNISPFSTRLASCTL